MKTNLKKVRIYRRYSEDFKKQLVADYESGHYSIVELERLHGINNASIYRWVYKYSTFNKKGYRVVEMKDSSIKKVKDLENRIKDLEGIVGVKQIRIDYLEKLIELAGEEFDIDMKKKLLHPTINWFFSYQKQINFSMNSLYREVGISKQAVYQYGKRQTVFDGKVTQLIVDADQLRDAHPGCGVAKMYYILKPDFIGRDRFVELMMQLGYRLKTKKNYKRTTIASKVYYSNLIKGMSINGSSQLWQSDITYIRVGEKFYYAVFIIDVYTKVIVGYCVSDSLRAIANVKALKMAFKDYTPPRIHHSDRGSQYICKDYVAMLENKNCAISMGLTAQDNAYAERINRTIKEEYLEHWKPKSLPQLKRDVKRAVVNYNTVRVHESLGYQSPKDFEKKLSLLACQQRKSITIFDNGI